MNENNENLGIGVSTDTPAHVPVSEPVSSVPPIADIQPPVTHDEGIMDDEEPLIDVPLPTTQETVEVKVDEPVPTDEQDQEQPQPEKEEIWDEGDFPEIPESNIRNIKPVFERAKEDIEADIALSPSTIEVMTKAADALEKVGTDAQLIWMLNLIKAQQVTPNDDVMMRRVGRDGADWSQRLELNDGKKGYIGFRPNAFSAITGAGVEISGAEALDRFMYGTGLGAPLTIPLVNTGIWVKIRSSGANLLAELDRALATARVQVGLDTNGMTGSTDDLAFREVINEYAMRLIEKSNFPVRDPMELREIIDIEDMRTLEWALAKIMFPKGITVSIPCINPSCDHVDTFKANPSRMFFMDRSRLTPKQFAFLSRGLSKPMTLEDVKEYKEEFNVGNKGSKTIRFGETDRTFIFRSSTIADYLQIGRAWLTSINNAVDVAMAKNPDDDLARSRAIESAVDVEAACRFAHYIAEVHIHQDDENYAVVRDPDAIRGILQLMSSDGESIAELIEAIDDFIVEIGASIVGYVNVPCSKCNLEGAPAKLKNRLILPFDAATGFFILAQRKIYLAGGAPLVNLETFGVENFVQQAQVIAQEESLQKQEQ